MPKETDYGVFEMGMNHAGELTELSNIVQPDIALITTVAPAHLAHFENVEAIADAKAEIMHGIQPGGILIVNADNTHTPRIVEQAMQNKVAYTTFGHASDCLVKVKKVDLRASGSQMNFEIDGDIVGVNFPLPGGHWVSNIAACLCVAKACKLNLHKAAKTLETFGAVAGRGEMYSLSIEGGSITFIDDSYNANPTSMLAAISVLSSQPGRKLAVLGDMFELGKDELTMHADLAIPLKAANVARVIMVGECMRALRGALPIPMRGPWVDSAEAALTALLNEIKDGDVVLVKGSNGVGLSRLVAAMKTKGMLHAL